MAIATRVNATNASVYTIDGVSWLADIIDCEVTINNTTEDAKGAVDDGAACPIVSRIAIQRDTETGCFHPCLSIFSGSDACA